MKAGYSSARYTSSHLPFVILTLAILGITIGCGSSGSTPPPKFTGNTSVTVVLSSTANDQVMNFNLQLQSLTLISQSGKTITLLSSQEPAEFMHLNGRIEPLTTISIPQDIYTSATATLENAHFICVSQDPSGGLHFFDYSGVDQGPVVNLASPITVTGDTMALSLDLLVSSSAIVPSCYSNPPFSGYSLSPTFSLAPLALSSSPTNAKNGMVSGLEATITSVNTSGSSLTLMIPAVSYGTRTVTARAGSATVFQGVGGFSALAPGMFLNLDGALQSDGSLLASRIEVQDPSAVNVSSGPVLFVDTLVPTFTLYGRTELGTLLTDITGVTGGYAEYPYFSFSNAAFQISGQFANLQSLPFVPSFNASNMVPGQNVNIASQSFSFVAPAYTLADTITLAPQTINGTVTASQQIGSFTDYTVSLASYDLFPTLAVQQGQTTLLNNPGQVEVYVDSNTQTLNTQALATGSTLRFYGLVFNDNGTLRMDCSQVNDGVASTPQTANAKDSQVRPLQISSRVEHRSVGISVLRQVITTER
jgi:hypothetical protein